MNIRYDKYCEIKDNVCLVYKGHCPEYLLLMKLVRPAIIDSLPGLSIHICGNDHFMHLLDGVENTVPLSRLDTKHEFFGYIKQIQPTMSSPHPIDVLLSESGIGVPVICEGAASQSRLCCIFSQGELPTRNLTSEELDQCRALAMREGYDVRLNPDIGIVQDAGWVIGVESAGLVFAAERGIRTNLVSTGIGEKVYRQIFPAMEILKLN